MYLVEHQATAFVARVTHAVHAGGPEATEASEVDIEASDAWRYAPDVGEHDAGKIAAPAEGKRYCTDEGQAGVAAILAGIETFVAVTPDAVLAVATVRLCDHIFEHRLHNA